MVVGRALRLVPLGLRSIGSPWSSSLWGVIRVSRSVGAPGMKRHGMTIPGRVSPFYGTSLQDV